MTSKNEQLANYINEAKIVCFYGGAGTSTESGIKDYRSQYGIWTMMEENGQHPQYYAHINRLKENPEEFFRVRKRPMETPKPIATHRILANLEKRGKDIRVITQNVDGLHQQAGHRYVLELHGNNREWHCMECERIYHYEELDFDYRGVPRCYVDQAVIRPNVVYFGENANRETIEMSKHTLESSDLLIVAGTSLTTPLAKRLVQHYKGNRIVVINNDFVDISPLQTDLFIQESIGEVFQAIEPYLK